MTLHAQQILNRQQAVLREIDGILQVLKQRIENRVNQNAEDFAAQLCFASGGMEEVPLHAA